MTQLMQMPPVPTVDNIEQRDAAVELSKGLKQLHKERSAWFDSEVAPLKEQIAKVKALAQLDAIEDTARKILAAVAVYDKRQEAARTRVLIDQAAAGRPLPVAVEPAKPIPTVRRLVIDSVDMYRLPDEYKVADQSAIKADLKIGRPVDGVKWHWEEAAQWKS